MPITPRNAPKRRREGPDPPQRRSRRRLVTLEEGKRLSASSLWDLQRAFFAGQDPNAWSRGRVPSYITSNAFIARAAARVLDGFVADAAAGRLGAVDEAQPLHVLELGAGSGRFAYGVLRALEARGRRGGLQVRYVVTDFDPAPLEALRKNAHLQPFVGRGLLDFAVLDAEAPGPVRLLEGGATLAPSAGANPLAVVANYVLDGLRTDAFEVRRGRLLESRARLQCPRGLDPASPATLPRLVLSFKQAPAPPSPYGDPELDRLLVAVAAAVEEGHFLFPASAIRLLRHLRALGGGRLLFLAADRGHVHPVALQGLEPPRLMRHGSVSLDVNFHALAEHARATEGLALLPPYHPTHLATTALLWGCTRPEEARVTAAYHEHYGAGGPEDVYLLKEILEEGPKKLDLERGLAWLRVSAWDPEVFLACAPVFLEQIDKVGPTEREDLLDAARRVREAYFPLLGDLDLHLALAELLQALDALPEAVALCHESLRLHGRKPPALHRLAACLAGLERVPEARALLDEALAIAPRFRDAQAMRKALDRKRRPGAPRGRARRP